MWYTILITLVVDAGGLLVLYALLRDRVRRATTSESQIAQIREEVSRLLVELNRTTDRNIVLMEDRIGSINELLAAADKKIGLLQREIEKHDVGTKIYSRLAQGRSPAVGGAPGPFDARRAAPEAPPAGPSLAVELSERPEEGARTRGGEDATARRGEGAPKRRREGPVGSEGDLQERVMMLHRAGFTSALIAGRVGIPLGEVELIISLEQRKGKA
jgi:hypothetical protein